MAESDDQKITFADLGVTPREATTDSYFGKRRKYSDLDRWEIVFLVISLIGLLATIGLTIERIISVTGVDFTFAVLILINSVFVVYYALDGVFRERAYELIVFIIAVCIIIAYCIINFIGTHDEHAKHDIVKLTRLVLVIALGPFTVVLGVVLAKRYHESRNLIFRTVGANTELQDMCDQMFLFEALLKLDLQLVISMFVLVLRDGYNVKTVETILLFTGLFYAAVWVIIGYCAMRFENKTLVWIFLATSILEPAYIVYKMVDLGLTWDSYVEDGIYLAAVTVVCAMASLIVRITVVVVMIKVYKNFGKGLMQKVYTRSSLVKNDGHLAEDGPDTESIIEDHSTSVST